MGQAALPLSMIGSAILASVTAPEGQELSSFEGTPGSITDPKPQAGNLAGYLNNYLQMSLDEATRPMTVNTTVHPLPSFSGGGLPFDIGAPAVDPNRLDASRRTTQLYPDDSVRDPGGWPHNPNPQPDQDPDEEGPWYPGPKPIPAPSGTGLQPRTLQPRPGYSGPASDDVPTLGGSSDDVSGQYDLEQFGGGDLSDLDQAEGAIALLLKQLGQG